MAMDTHIRRQGVVRPSATPTGQQAGLAGAVRAERNLSQLRNISWMACKTAGAGVELVHERGLLGAEDAQIDLEGLVGRHVAGAADGADGAQGPQGEPGADGQDGADGADGAAGTDGVDGQDGEDGSDCTVSQTDCQATLSCEDGTSVSWELYGCSCDN